MPTYQVNIQLETYVQAKSDKVAVERAHDAMNAVSTHMPGPLKLDGWPGLHEISIRVVDSNGVQVPT